MMLLPLKQTGILLIFSHKKKDSITKMISRTDKFESSSYIQIRKNSKKELIDIDRYRKRRRIKKIKK